MRSCLDTDTDLFFISSCSSILIMWTEHLLGEVLLQVLTL